MDASLASASCSTASKATDREVKLVSVASLIGTTIEWYDFFLYGTITGLVFNKLYFPSDNAFVSTMLAYTVYAGGFATRPLGGSVFGHFGDTIGRRPLLVLTLMIMGISTFLIGLVRGKLSGADILRSLLETTRTTAAVFTNMYTKSESAPRRVMAADASARYTAGRVPR